VQCFITFQAIQWVVASLQPNPQNDGSPVAEVLKCLFNISVATPWDRHRKKFENHSCTTHFSQILIQALCYLSRQLGQPELHLETSIRNRKAPATCH
jgi:hypothetical protein